MSTETECWTALKDYLAQQIEQDLAVRQAALIDGDLVSANAHGTLVSANRSTLAKMRELEAGQ